ncbi:hypothetical protein ACFYSI_13105 [Staphylococcus xylosus]|uniref:hypothetical protein n=1 Tax=Staphylococcus xylosus TaxID=1288 RepID=UPI0036CEBA40
MMYKLYDSVLKETYVFSNYEELKEYATMWQHRLNRERFKGESEYTTDTFREVEDIFEVCNIEFLVID